MDYKDFSGVSKHCSHKPSSASTEELSHQSGKAFVPVQQVALRCCAGTIPGGVQNLTGQRPEQPILVSLLALSEQEVELSILRVSCCLICPVSQ